MTAKNQEIYNMIETLPEEISDKVLEYIEYLKYNKVINTAPENLVVKDKDDLRKKFEEGEEDIKNGKVRTLDDVFDEIDDMLA